MPSIKREFFGRLDGLDVSVRCRVFVATASGDPDEENAELASWAGTTLLDLVQDATGTRWDSVQAVRLIPTAADEQTKPEKYWLEPPKRSAPAPRPVTLPRPAHREQPAKARKPISIAVLGDSYVLIALADDGTIWQREAGKWVSVAGLPQPTKDENDAEASVS